LALGAVAAALASAQTKEIKTFDPSVMDRSANPCTDFYQFACGGWLKNNPIPADQSRWGRFSELQERNRETLRQILETAAKPAPTRDPIDQKIGDYYAACMDEAGIERRGLTGLQPELDRIRAIRDVGGVAAVVGRLHRSGIPTLFGFGSGQDFKDSTEVIAQADQGGLGLPEREYYLKPDAKSVELRRQYVAHVARMFELAGRPAAEAKALAGVVMEIETALAKGSLDLVSRRDPEKIYHRMKRAELEELSPRFAWAQYLTAAGAPAFADINVGWPDFFRALDGALGRFGVPDWRTYLEWHLLHNMAPLLPARFVDADFDFFRRTLTGAKQNRPRWKRCVDFADNQLGEALGRRFVERTFGEEGKRRTLDLVHGLEKALAEDIGKLPWMTPATREQALVKLRAIGNKIGYPEKWRDYSPVRIERDDAVGNAMRADRFEFARQLAKIGQPIDRTEWAMSPPTVNAYYDPQMNNINFPAGILQPPFYDNKADDAANFGAIGAVIGHELTHGFDDEGRQFDAKGNLRDWWTEADAKEFDRRAACFAEQYSKFEPVPGAKVNGKLTLGENVADAGGVRIALMALLNRLDGRGKAVDGMSAEQRFFVAFGQIWCEHLREERLRLQVSTDPHSPARYRVNGVLQNSPEFQKVFSCKPAQPMTSSQPCRVW
jgi:endothelin-converting enzyme/putative endopeptidase